jgi:hypothetical protein
MVLVLCRLLLIILTYRIHQYRSWLRLTSCGVLLCSPFGYITRDDGAGGNAERLAPPGRELKDGATLITECELGFYKVRQ